jgi:hypothetical protein
MVHMQLNILQLLNLLPQLLSALLRVHPQEVTIMPLKNLLHHLHHPKALRSLHQLLKISVPRKTPKPLMLLHPRLAMVDKTKLHLPLPL